MKRLVLVLLLSVVFDSLSSHEIKLRQIDRVGVNTDSSQRQQVTEIKFETALGE